MNRRKFLTACGLGSLALSTSSFGLGLFKSKSPKRLLRIAHITDIHVNPTPAATEGFSRLIKNLDSTPGIDFILNGGDSIMDSMQCDAPEADRQWAAFNSIMKCCTRPVYNCIGNHDVYGWARKRSEIDAHPEYGKSRPVRELNIPNRYYSFEHSLWKFIILDSTFLGPDGYIGKIDDEQFAWLQSELSKSSRRHVCILSHIPIVCTSAFFADNTENTGTWIIPPSWIHIDAKRLKDVFRKYSNVRLCLSGHMHMVDAANYLGTTYLNNGAASGNWWNGNYYEFAPAYALIDLFSDGSFNHQLVYYNWH